MKPALLLVDDDETIRSQMKWALADDYEVLTAEDRPQAVAAFGNVQLTPTSFLIDPRGQIVMHKIGEMDMQRLHRQIEDMLNSKQAG